MARPTALICVVGLTRALLRHAPRLRALGEEGTCHRLRPTLPAVTASVQASMRTGVVPEEHGIVGNGWYNRELNEIHFWKQSNRLVRAEELWEAARRHEPGVRTANICWWFNMATTVDFLVTPRPCYKADGRKIPDCYTEPPALRHQLQKRLGTFPLFQFWGPGSSAHSSEWIVEAAKLVQQWHGPDLSLVYLPHLDYALQKHGPGSGAARAAVGEIDRIAGDLIDFFRERDITPIVVSEYGIEPVERPVWINRVLREAGELRVRDEQGGEILDTGGSGAFAVADHQVAHVYVRDPERVEAVRELLADVDGVASVLDRSGQRAAGLAHERAGDLTAIAEAGAWFAYPYWLEDAHAPDFARTVEIHRKPGYDPAELFIDPAIRFPRARIAAKLLRKRLGLRTLFDVVPLDASLVRGSHGRTRQAPENQPVLLTPDPGAEADELPSTAVRNTVIDTLFPPG